MPPASRRSRASNRDCLVAGPAHPRPSPRPCRCRIRRSSPAWWPSMAEPGDLVVCLGAGSITNWAHALPDELAKLLGKPQAAAGNRTMMAARCNLQTPDRAAAAGARALTENAALAGITWFRVGGPAEVMFRPADRDDLAAFLCTQAGRRAGHGDRRRLQPAGARRRRARRGHPPRPRLRRRRDRRHDACAPAPRRSTSMSRSAARDAGVAGLEFLSRHPRHHRRRAAHERRRLWQGDEGRDRQRRGARRARPACTA